jgi:hypothetical protein
MFQRVKWGLAVVITCLGSGCDEDDSQCLAACIGGFSMHLESGAALPDGDYEIEVTLPGESFICHRTLPENDEQARGDCHIESRVQVGGIEPMETGARGFFVSTQLTPATVAVTVRREGVVLANESFTPEYRTSEICGSSCRGASESVRLPTLTSVDAGIAPDANAGGDAAAGGDSGAGTDAGADASASTDAGADADAG